jgi:alkanesulfonate monooxygenase SsuD/methylene tetrahydromethanopterin reductase-like flavin-dependent oxidoreductase (luciferase family)
MGLDYLAIQDHAYNPQFLDVWTLIAYLAAETNRISFFPDVADLQLRPPTILAKAAASLSVLTGGRIVLGVGGGASVGGIAAMGGIRRTRSEMIAFTEEALQFMRTALAGGVVKFRSGQHTIEGYEAGPVSASPLPLWLGSNGPRMLAVTGRSSDGWISPLSTYVDPTAVPSRQRLIDDAARSAGRDPADVRRIYNVVGAIGPARRGPGLAGDVESWGGGPHRLVGGSGLRHVHLLADDRAAGPAGSVRRPGRPWGAAARQRTSRPTMKFALAASTKRPST